MSPRIAMVALLLACNAPVPASTATAEPKTATIVIDSSTEGYTVRLLEIGAGTVVTWMNTDKAYHTVTYSKTEDPRRPDGTFDLEGLLFNFELPGEAETAGKGSSASFTFTTPGTYHYFCLPHADRMRAVLVVR